jgi:hypothetical protein
MWKSAIGLTLVMSSADALAASSSTDFGIRTLGGNLGGASLASEPAAMRSSVNLRSVAGLGAQWGRVTSTYRSPAHNRAVGGVRNSFHLSGRAIDIARRAGVTHAQIAAAYRNAGYYLIESLDEGDHSHFAFGSAPSRSAYVAVARTAVAATSAAGPGVFMAPRDYKEPATKTRWGIVSVSRAVLK